MTSSAIIKLLKEDGWYEKKPRTPGVIRHFRHATKKGKVTIKDPAKDVPINVLKYIERQSGLCLSGVGRGDVKRSLTIPK